MTRRILPTSLLISTTLMTFAFSAATVALVPGRAFADEDDDIQRQIDTQKSGVSDLEHLDENHTATAELQRLRDWLSQAWELRSKHEPDEARGVLDRCLAQAELVRQMITAAQVTAEVADKEDKLKKTREETERKKKALQEAQVKRKALETTVGS